jgi:DNA-binding response OmpR family regulator
MNNKKKILAVDDNPDNTAIIEECQRLRKYSSLSETKIIMVTAKGELEDKVTGYEVGASDYITKPFDEENILESVEFFL